MKAYVLLNTELGKEPDAIKAMNGVKEIIAVHSLYGIYDILVEVEAETMERVKEIVFRGARDYCVCAREGLLFGTDCCASSSASLSKNPTIRSTR